MGLNAAVEVFPSGEYAAAVAGMIADALTPGPIVITGGGTAAAVYEALAPLPIDWDAQEILFSDERAVPPTDDASNYRMAAQTLFEPAGVSNVLRMRGEDDPEIAAAAYEAEIAGPVERGIRLQILGLGADCHIAALFPGSPGLSQTERLVVAVDRPDGMRGITLTPPALIGAEQTFVIVTGSEKAAAVRRALRSDEPVEACPVHLLHDPIFLLDDAAASTL